MLNMHQGVCLKMRYKKDLFIQVKNVTELFPRTEVKPNVFLLLDIQVAWLPFVLIFLNSSEFL